MKKPIQKTSVSISSTETFNLLPTLPARNAYLFIPDSEHFLGFHLCTYNENDDNSINVLKQLKIQFRGVSQSSTETFHLVPAYPPETHT